jgi:hypothetical protein
MGCGIPPCWCREDPAFAWEVVGSMAASFSSFVLTHEIPSAQ